MFTFPKEILSEKLLVCAVAVGGRLAFNIILFPGSRSTVILKYVCLDSDCTIFRYYFFKSNFRETFFSSSNEVALLYWKSYFYIAGVYLEPYQIYIVEAFHEIS